VKGLEPPYIGVGEMGDEKVEKEVWTPLSKSLIQKGSLEGDKGYFQKFFGDHFGF
jgi:hypothetical protein